MMKKKKVTFTELNPRAWKCSCGDERLGVVERPFRHGEWCFVPVGNVVCSADDLETIAAFLRKQVAMDD